MLHSTVEIVNIYPHNPSLFTEGLTYSNGRLWESTGKDGQSIVCELDIDTGKVLRYKRLPDNYFGEGLVIIDNVLIQLTWKDGIALIYDADTLQIIDTIPYESQGWGITSDDQYIYMGDGSSNLVIRDKDTFDIIDYLPVTLNGKILPKELLNELEYVDGYIYANLWSKSKNANFKGEYIVKINKSSGIITNIIDCTDIMLLAESDNEMNGIAYNAQDDTFFITGKYWEYLFEISIE